MKPIREGKLVVRVRLEGRRTSVLEDVLVDTGSTFTVLPPEIVEQLELEPFREPKVRLTTAAGFIEAPVRVLPSIDVEGTKLENIPIVVHRIPDPAPIKVLLGMNLIEKVKLTVDGKGSKFELKDPV